jgi:hypothetical protein
MTLPNRIRLPEARAFAVEAVRSQGAGDKRARDALVVWGQRRGDSEVSGTPGRSLVAPSSTPSCPQKGQSEDWPNRLILLARPERFERPTPWFVAKYSIQLSYGRLAVFERRDYTQPIRLLKHYLAAIAVCQ